MSLEGVLGAVGTVAVGGEGVPSQRARWEQDLQREENGVLASWVSDFTSPGLSFPVCP